MKRILFVLILVAGAWFAWPFYSLYSIYSGMKNADLDTLKNKIEWTSLRTSAAPVVTSEVDDAINLAVKEAGSFGSLLKGQIGQYKKSIIDTAMDTYVNPEGATKVFKYGGDMTAMVGEVVGKQITKITESATAGTSSSSGLGSKLGGWLGGLTGGEKAGVGSLLTGFGGKIASSVMKGGSGKGDAGSNSKQKWGFSNLKHFAYGFTNMEIGVARNPKKKKSDVIAVMEFKDWDWKLTKIRKDN